MPTYHCKTCGTPIESSDTNASCPPCLLRMGIEEPTIAQDLKQFDLPTPAELDIAIPRLTVKELIAHGGMGAVYKAKQKDLDRVVAVKVLPAELSKNDLFVERFAQEARTLASLNHPNIVTVHDSGIAEGWCYIVMEYVDGVTLRDAISESRISPERALQIVPELCDALKIAHQQGIVHRDIKPENILLTKDGEAKIADFGIAKLLHRSGDTEFNAGTKRYMAPEQLFGNPDVDHRADIYSLGVVLYELLTGTVPSEDYIPPSKTTEVDRRIDLVVQKTLERRPEYRYQDVREIAEEIERVREDEIPQDLRRIAGMMNLGVDWSSRARIFGHPVIHVATGIDSKTGKKRIAKGWIAVGDIAIGGLALGGVGCGVIGVGGLGAGLVGIGGLGLGALLGTGGGAVGLVANGGGAAGGLAQGGGAAGGIAIGGGAAGYVAIGGGARGEYTISGQGVSPDGWLETGIGEFVTEQLPDLMVSLPLFIFYSLLIPILLVAVLRLFREREPNQPLLAGSNTAPLPKLHLLGIGFGIIAASAAVFLFAGQGAIALTQVLEMTLK